MASESKKSETKKSVTRTPKNQTAKKETKAIKKNTTKKEPVKKTTTKKTTQKTKEVKKETAITATKEKATTKRKIETETKKVVTKQPVKVLEIAEEKIVPVQKEVPKSKVEPKKDVHEHFGVYLCLLSTVLICLHVMSRFHLEIGEITIGYSVILFSTIYFVSNVITKKFDFKKSIFAIIISSIAMIVFVYFTKFLNTKVVDSFIVFGQVFAYIISQLLNLIIYYYLLVNTELKARWIFITYIFALTSYYFIEILFSTRIIITDTFWPTFFCSVILSGILAIMYAFYDSLIKRGQE